MQLFAKEQKPSWSSTMHLCHRAKANLIKCLIDFIIHDPCKYKNKVNKLVNLSNSFEAHYVLPLILLHSLEEKAADLDF